MIEFAKRCFTKFASHWKYLSNHARLLLSFYLVFMILNPNTMADIIREPKLEVVVDNVHKEASVKENAIFYWNVYNNESFITFEITVQSEPNTEFSESSFSLAPGQKREITQTIDIPDCSENITNLSYDVHWNAMMNIGATSGSFSPWSGYVNVTVINETEPVQTFQYDIPNPNTSSNYLPILMTVLILLLYILHIIIRKRLITKKWIGRKKELSKS